MLDPISPRNIRQSLGSGELKAAFGTDPASDDRMPVTRGYTIAKYPALHSPPGPLVTFAEVSTGFEWLSMLLKVLWPHIDGAAEKLLKETILPEVNAQIPMGVTVSCTKFGLESTPLSLDNFVVTTADNSVRLDLDVTFEVCPRPSLAAGNRQHNVVHLPTPAEAYLWPCGVCVCVCVCVCRGARCDQ